MGGSVSKDEDLQKKETHENVINNKTEEKNDGNSSKRTTTTTIHVANNNNNTAEVKFPYRYLEILKEADTQVDESSTQKLLQQLQDGVFLNQKKKKYWVDKKLKNNFLLLASDLLITWAEDTKHWHWYCTVEPVVEAELLNVCWLEVHARFNTINLTPKTLYEVVFLVKLKDPAYGWEIPVNLRLLLLADNNTKQERKESLMGKPKGQLIELFAGEFKTLPENMGDIEISLYEYEGGVWKRGLIILGVVIRPKD